MNERMLALQFTIAVFGIWWLYFIEYRSYLLAEARQNLFAVRDALFTAAERGDLPFNSDAYIMTRNLLNGAIRFTHRLTAIRVIGILVAHAIVRGPKAPTRFSKEYSAALQKLDKTGRAVVENAHIQMHIILILHLAKRSLFLSIFNILTTLLIGVRKVVAKRILRTKKWAILDMEIKEVGEGRICSDDLVQA